MLLIDKIMNAHNQLNATQLELIYMNISKE